MCGCVLHKLYPLNAGTVWWLYNWRVYQATQWEKYGWWTCVLCKQVCTSVDFFVHFIIKRMMCRALFFLLMWYALVQKSKLINCGYKHINNIIRVKDLRYFDVCMAFYEACINMFVLTLYFCCQHSALMFNVYCCF